MISLRQRLKAAGQVSADSKGLLVLATYSIVALRTVTMVQIVVALPASVASSQRPSVALALAGLFFVESGILFVVLIRGRTPRRRRLLAVDVTALVFINLGQLAYVADDSALSSWDAWGFGVLLASILFIPLALSSMREVVATAAILATSYLIFAIPAGRQSGELVTAIVNTIGIIANAVAVRLIWVYLLRLAAQADHASSRANDALHDGAGGLAFLDHFISSLDHPDRDHQLASLRPLLVRFRTTVAGTHHEAGGAKLTDAVADAAAGFTVLPITMTTGLLDDHFVEAPVRDALHDVVWTLLANVRQHANATAVTIFGEVQSTGGSEQMMVSINDNGAGFEPDRVTRSHGLGVQIHRLAPYGGTVTITSVPGQGTLAVITLPLLTETAAS